MHEGGGVMNTYRTQSKQPKQPTTQQILDRFRRDMQALGYAVDIDHGSGLYAPLVQLNVWPKQVGKEVKA